MHVQNASASFLRSNSSYFAKRSLLSITFTTKAHFIHQKMLTVDRRKKRLLLKFYLDEERRKCVHLKCMSICPLHLNYNNILICVFFKSFAPLLLCFCQKSTCTHNLYAPRTKHSCRGRVDPQHLSCVSFITTCFFENPLIPVVVNQWAILSTTY